MNLQLSELAEIVGGELLGENQIITSLSTNTRELTAGQLFIALKGAQFDGHDFLQSAYEKKAAGVIISKRQSLPIPSITVEDTKLALGKIAAFHRQQFPIPVIAITGSCGKTTTTAILATILNCMAPTLAPIKSFNNDIGVPLTLLQLTSKHRYAVIEMGANHPGEIAYLSRLAGQQFSIITNVAPAHLDGFKTLAGVASAKGEIFEALADEGMAVINADDQFADYWRKLIKNKKMITFGIKKTADVYAKNIGLTETGNPQFELFSPHGKCEIRLPLLGEHNVKNALAAIAAAIAVGATKEAIQQGLASVQPVSSRLNNYKGLAGAVVIDDTYNANPLSVEAALQTLAHRKGERFFIFGDMAGLGQDEADFHREIGLLAKRLGIDKLLACGKLSELAVNQFGKNGYHFESQASLIETLKSQLHDDAIVLVKGSRSSQMENIVQAIIQEK